MHGVFCTREFSEGIAGEPHAATARVRMEVPEGPVLFPTQVHGDRIVLAKEARDMPEADGIISDNPDDILGILTADCLPVLAWSDDPPLIAALHAGWRGLAAGIVAQGIQRMRSLGARTITLSLGPAIGPCCFAVQADVLNTLRHRPVRQAQGHFYLDLWEIAIAQARRAGVARHQIRTLRLCTRCHPELFFSYRRDGRAAGRNITLMGGRTCRLPGLRAG